MSKSSKKQTAESALKRTLRTPMFRMRVVRDRTKYNRKANRSMEVGQD